MKSRNSMFAIALAALLALPLAGQQAKAPAAKTPAVPRDDDPQYKIRTRSELVVVPVTVKDSAGLLVSDIRADEFRIFEDGKEQEISLYSVDSFPLSVVVLLDNSLQTKEAAMLQQSAPTLAAGFGEFDEVALMVFGEYPQPQLEFTRDNDKLFDHLKRLQLESTFPGQGSAAMTRGPRSGTTSEQPGVNPKASTSSGKFTKNLDDAVYAAAQALRHRGRERRKIIFLITDGTNSNRNEMSFDDTLKLLLSADISVYAVSLNPLPLGGVRSPLGRYAKATGGDVFYAKTRQALETLFSRVTEQARNQYTLAYAPRDTDRTLDYHSIEVRVRRPALTIIARDGYYALPPP